MNRIIAHLDMDSFFASIEERDNPRIKGRPIAVGSDPLEGRGRGVVSTANYKAREYGIRSALPISRAWEYSEKARREGKDPVVFLDVDMKKYLQVSERIIGIVKKYSEKTEQASVDEIYLDLSFAGSFFRAQKICENIKREITEKEKLTASIGLAPNKLIAKIASDMQKPNGLTVIYPEGVEGFLSPLSIRKIPGIGPKTEQVFNRKGDFLINDIKKYSIGEMERMFGKWGKDLFEKVRGIDDYPVTDEYERKSIGEQETFNQDTADFNVVASRMEKLCENVIGTLADSEFSKFKSVSITVRFDDFTTKTRSHTLRSSTNLIKSLKAESFRLLMPFFDSRENPQRKKIRLIGVRIEKFN